MFDDESERKKQAKLNSAIARENAAIAKLDKPTDDIIDDIPDAPKKKQLVRDIKAAALVRLEEAARTEEEFRKVVEQWDKRDANRERKERYHEISRGDNLPIEYGISSNSAYNRNFVKAVSRGDFIDVIYDNPQEIEQLVTELYMYEILKNLKPKDKDLLYYIAVLGLTNQQLAELREQTDRNIRKVRKTLLNKTRKKVYEYLKDNKNHNFTLLEKRFVENYLKLIDNSE